MATVPLTFPKNGYRQVGKDDILHMLLPQRTLYPNSRIYVPVFLEQPENEHGPISAIVIRYTHLFGDTNIFWLMHGKEIEPAFLFYDIH